jgi:class 3 adenylate cyclase
MSSRFAELLGHSASRSVGPHALKGFDEPVELFTMQPMRPHAPPL